jgi:hypothetical protein
MAQTIGAFAQVKIGVSGGGSRSASVGALHQVEELEAAELLPAGQRAKVRAHPVCSAVVLMSRQA